MRRFSTAAARVKPTQTKMVIGGKFVPSASGKTFKTINPATEEAITDIPEAAQEDVNRAVAAAREAFDHGPWTKSISAEDRGRLMYRFADLLEKHADELAALETLDNGKPLTAARAGDIELSIRCIRYYAGWADKTAGILLPVPGHFSYSRHEPVGVCAQVLPFNFPLLMAAWKLGPVLDPGCVTILKPAEQTPLTCLRTAELALEAGIPPGVINVLTGFGETGRLLVENRGVDKVAFTGSTEVGYHILRNCHKHNIKRVTMELGGKSPNIILDDADIDDAIAQSQLGLFLNQGQCCVAGTRLFVQEKIYDEFVKKSVAAARKRVVGDPWDKKTEQGPQIDGDQLKKIQHFVETGVKEGANLLTGGKRVGNKGFFFEPTVFSDVKDDMLLAREEHFGPIMSILKFRTIDEVIERANNTSYGLGAGVVTKNIDNALKIAHSLRVGTVYVNCYDSFSAHTTFGGFKDSGVGRELGPAGLDSYLEKKTVTIKPKQ